MVLDEKVSNNPPHEERNPEIDKVLQKTSDHHARGYSLPGELTKDLYRRLMDYASFSSAILFHQCDRFSRMPVTHENGLPSKRLYFLYTDSVVSLDCRNNLISIYAPSQKRIDQVLDELHVNRGLIQLGRE